MRRGSSVFGKTCRNTKNRFRGARNMKIQKSDQMKILFHLAKVMESFERETDKTMLPLFGLKNVRFRRGGNDVDGPWDMGS